MQKVKQSVEKINRGVKRRRSVDQIVAIDISNFVESIRILKERRPTSEKFYKLADELADQLERIRYQGVSMKQFNAVQSDLNDKITNLNSFVDADHRVKSQSVNQKENRRVKRKRSSEEIVQVDISGYIDAIKVLKERRPSNEMFYNRAEEMIDELMRIWDEGVAESKYDSTQQYLKARFAALIELSKQNE
jgi:uncharacterized protein YukE